MLRNLVLISIACAPFAVRSSQEAAVQSGSERLQIPAKLVPKDKQVLFMARGEGVQIYVAKENEGKVTWVFQSPRADLLDYKTGENVGKHSGGPSWVDRDGGKLTGRMLASEPAPNSDAVAWLLLETKSDGSGRFAAVTNIQRIDTWGGKAPSIPPTKAGETREMRYEATYVFLGDR